jgi:hypothetical protein
LEGFPFLSAKPLLLVISIDEADISSIHDTANLAHLGDMLN